MRTVDFAKVSANLEEYTRELDKSPLIITKRGKPVAALVAVDDLDIEALALSANLDFWAIIERSRARHAAEGGISSEDVRLRLV